MSSIGQRLKEFGIAVFGNPTAFARALGWDSASLYKYYKGRQAPGAKLSTRLAEIGCNLSWLRTGDGEMYSDSTAGWQLQRKFDASSVRKGQVPLFLEPIPAGMPNAIEGEVEQWVNLHEYVVTKPLSMFAARVSGDSMIGAGILDGDVIVVDRSAEPKSGAIIAAEYGGKLTVKRLLIEDGGVVTLMPENRNYQPIVITSDDAKILGVVVAALHKFTK